ncbi:MAG TPA: IclR family transcriptional regulator [Glaciihabitans sp.]|jgi:DNA-binding IclR family transcriptional regulator|nr:IclR family transcriptional regulator [Glaciihabitans sp.]
MTLTERPPSTTERVAQVLMCFAADQQWLGVSDIARRLGLGKSVVHRILQTFVECGLVSYNSTQRLYGLGPSAFALGRRAHINNDVRAAGMPAAAHLAAITGETAILSARMGHERVYVGQIESAQAIRITVKLGQSVPLAAGANGNSMLAFMSESDIDLALQVPLPQYTANTVVDPEEIRARLAVIRQRGWASTSGERIPMSMSIAAPIFDASSVPVGALSVGVLETRDVGRSHEDLAVLVVAAAKQASAALQKLQTGADS